MVPLLIVLLLVLLLFGAGFLVEALWWVAIIALAIWVAGFLFRPATGGRRGRWYRW